MHLGRGGGSGELTSPVESKGPRYRIMASYFSKATAKVASLLRPTIYSLNAPIFLARFISSAKPVNKDENLEMESREWR